MYFFHLSQLVIRGFAGQALRNYTQFAVEKHCEQLLRADRYIALFFDGENSLFQISDYSGSINNTSNSSNDNNLIRHNHITKISKADMMNSYVSIKILHKAFLDTNNNEYAMKEVFIAQPADDDDFVYIFCTCKHWLEHRVVCRHIFTIFVASDALPMLEKLKLHYRWLLNVYLTSNTISSQLLKEWRRVFDCGGFPILRQLMDEVSMLKLLFDQRLSLKVAMDKVSNGDNNCGEEEGDDSEAQDGGGGFNSESNKSNNSKNGKGKKKKSKEQQLKEQETINYNHAHAEFDRIINQIRTNREACLDFTEHMGKFDFSNYKLPPASSIGPGGRLDKNHPANRLAAKRKRVQAAAAASSTKINLADDDLSSVLME